MADDHNNYINFLTFPYAQICATLCIGLPLLLFITALFKGNLAKNTNSG